MANYLTFSSAEPFTIATSNTQKNWNGTLYYSTDTTAWSAWDGTAAIASAVHDGEQRIYMRGIGNTCIANPPDHSSASWVITGSGVSCTGDIGNLLDYETIAIGERPHRTSQCYTSLFSGCTALITAPELPDTTLGYSAYEGMFAGCTSLKAAPALPATALGNWCYTSMFSGCKSLVTAPELPATTLAEDCYAFMFQGCKSLVTAPELPATTLAEGCYRSMFASCTSLKNAPKLPATTLAESCYAYMFASCYSLTTLPELPATTLAEDCYRSMFGACEGIKLSTTKTGEYTKEYRIPTSGTGTMATDALTNMFRDTGGTFTGTPEINTTYYLAVPVEPEAPADAYFRKNGAWVEGEFYQMQGGQWVKQPMNPYVKQDGQWASV